MRILMLVANSVQADVRVWREATTLRAAGHTVTIIGRDVPTCQSDDPGIEVLSASGGTGLRGMGGRVVRPKASVVRSRAARWLLLPEHRSLVFTRWSHSAAQVAQDVLFDVVHAHDFTALEVGSALARQRDVALVYDTHEWWSERRQVGRPTPLARRQDRFIEQRLGRQAAAVITVGDGLASRLRSQYGWQHIRVVRNTFPSTEAGPETPDQPTAALYAGRLAGGRDLETVASASRQVRLPIRLLGPTDATWVRRFDPGVCSMEEPVPMERVDAELRLAGLALVTLTARCGNHRYALPNKLFQAVRTNIPVVASDVGELGRLVAEYGLGTLYHPGSSESLARAIGAAQDRYKFLTANVRRAARYLSWSTDGATLVALYNELARA